MAPTIPDKRHWTVNWELNIGALLALAIQTAAMLSGAAWYSAKVDARIAALEATDIRLVAERDVRRKSTDDRIDALNKDRDRLVRVETLLEGAVRSISRIENKLDGARP